MPTVLITGAARGIGLGISRQYASSGWKVHACARTPDGLRGVPGDIHHHALDVTDHETVAALARELAGEAIDVLICNAGVNARQAAELGRIDAAQWRRTLEINALAPLVMAGAFVDHVARSGQRKLLAISSKSGSIALSDGGRYAYRASKAALNMAWKGLSHDTARRGVICAVLHPGSVQTDMAIAKADLTVQQSAAALVRTIDVLSPRDNGRFIDYDGSDIPW